jgi:hypothetical protein
MAEHTPTPWCVPEGADNESLVCQEVDGRAGIVIFGTADKFRSWQRRIEIDEQNANAAFIVKAVNRDHHFDLLVNALAEIKRATIEGRVCDDVAWFDQIETLHDFCDRILSNVGSQDLTHGKGQT